MTVAPVKEPIKLQCTGAASLGAMQNL